MTAPKVAAGAAVLTAAEKREHARLTKRWAVGRATSKEILRCIELDRRARWIAERRASSKAQA